MGVKPATEGAFPGPFANCSSRGQEALLWCRLFLFERGLQNEEEQSHAGAKWGCCALRLVPGAAGRAGSAVGPARKKRAVARPCATAAPQVGQHNETTRLRNDARRCRRLWGRPLPLARYGIDRPPPGT